MQDVVSLAGIRQVRPVGVETLKQSFENQGILQGNHIYLRESSERKSIDGIEEKLYDVIDGMHRVTALLEAKGHLGYKYSARIYRKDTPDSVMVAFSNGKRWSIINTMFTHAFIFFAKTSISGDIGKNRNPFLRC